MSPAGYIKCRSAIWALVFCALWRIAAAEHDHGNHAITLFLSADGLTRSGQVPASLKSSETTALADILVGLKHERWRFLSEFVLENTDEHEFERLQFGYEANDNTVFWLGRYHQPASVWNIFYHHGQYLQTSIVRPWIENWEDEGGVLPQHVVGVLMESQHSLGRTHALRVSAGVGLAPRLQGDELRPFDHFRDRIVAGQGHAGLRLEWLPDPIGEDTVGVVFSRAEVPVDRSSQFVGSHVDYGVYGAFFSLTNARLRTIGATYIMETEPDGEITGTIQRSVASYLQFDYSMTSALTAYTRVENTTSAKQSMYLRQFSDVMTRRALAGLRWQLPRKNALTLEFMRNTDLTDNTYNSTRLQWSAALP